MCIFVWASWTVLSFFDALNSRLSQKYEFPFKFECNVKWWEIKMHEFREQQFFMRSEATIDCVHAIFCVHSCVQSCYHLPLKYTWINTLFEIFIPFQVIIELFNHISILNPKAFFSHTLFTQYFVYILEYNFDTTCLWSIHESTRSPKILFPFK